jgi:hypothetical protein
MAIDKEFLGRLDREIASLKQRIESTKQDAGTSPRTETEASLLREMETLLFQLEETRERIVTQSTGG